MNSFGRNVVLLVVLLMLGALNAQAQTWCDASQLKALDDLKKDYRVIDARPSEVNKVQGKSAFKKKAQVVIVNMNPFMFKYDVKVDQSEIQDTAVLDFLKLLGSPITDVASAAAFRSVNTALDAEDLQAGANLDRLISRTGGPPAPAPAFIAPPPVDGACAIAMVPVAHQALNYLAETRDEMLRQKAAVEAMLAGLTGPTGKYQKSRVAYLENEDALYSPSSDNAKICFAANAMMNAFLDPADMAHHRATSYPSRIAINKLKDAIAKLDSLIAELKKSAEDFKGDNEFAKCQARYSGFLYADSLIELATAMTAYRQLLEKRAGAMSDETKAYDFLVKTIRSFAQLAPNGLPVPGASGPSMVLLQRTFDINGQYDISQLDIQLNSTELQPLKPTQDISEIDAFRISAAKDVTSGYQRSVQVINDVPVTTMGDLQAERAANFPRGAKVQRRNVSFADQQPAENGNQPATNNMVKANAVIGARRFELAGGMAFSTLGRREYKSVLGFARNPDGTIIDADGKPTDKRELTNIVGITESSSSRFAPLVMLHTRLTNNPTYNLFFSVGVTAKNDSQGLNVEYLLGPSFSFLNKNAFFTFGGYAGRVQKLAGDLFEGAKLPGTDVPVHKSYKWAPGFSFTYRIPVKSGSGK